MMSRTHSGTLHLDRGQFICENVVSALLFRDSDTFWHILTSPVIVILEHTIREGNPLVEKPDDSVCSDSPQTTWPFHIKTNLPRVGAMHNGASSSSLLFLPWFIHHSRTGSIWTHQTTWPFIIAPEPNLYASLQNETFLPTSQLLLQLSCPFFTLCLWKCSYFEY